MKIHAVYFSCGRDSRLLNLSIISLNKIYSNVGEIHVVEDKNDLVDKDVKQKLEKEGVIFRQTTVDRNANLRGLGIIGEMIDIYADIMKDKDEEDYIMKIDSDIVVSNDDVFKFVEKTDLDVVGGHPMAGKVLVPYNHFTGAAYFIKKHVAVDLPNLKWVDQVHQWKDIIGYHEDMTVSAMVNSKYDKIKVFPNGIPLSNGSFFTDVFLTDIVRHPKKTMEKYSFIHTRSRKDLMEMVFHIRFN